jgi:8-oxo-dGTP pyrophosphatase MutT (NUDIX family)
MSPTAASCDRKSLEPHAMASASFEPIPQATAIPFRWRQGRLEFCLITSSQKGHWAFPKGVVDPGETDAQTALKEAYEEAGLTGDIVGQPLGRYAYAKWGRKLRVTVRLMRVTDAADEWEESHVRQRCWATADEALTLIARPELRMLLERAVERIRVNGFTTYLAARRA